MRFAVLGSLQVEAPSGPVEIGRAKHRQLLVCLLQEPNQVVSADRLVERLWAERSTGGSTGTLQSYVSRLRKVLQVADPGTEPRLRFEAGGYRLSVGPDELDTFQFERLAGEGTAALDDDDPWTAWSRLCDALSLWRGEPLRDGADDSITRADASRLTEQRLNVVVSRADAGLALGHHAELVAELETVCAENPLHEGLWARRILGLYRCGRQADALATYQTLRRTTTEELGIEPSAELRQLEHQILTQDTALDWSPPHRGTAPTSVARFTSVPEVRYARLGAHEIAYQRWGVTGGPVLVGLPGFAQNIELLWEEPQAARWLRDLGEFCEVIHFDKLGTGLSQAGAPLSSFPDRAREIEAVMNHAEVGRAFVGGFSDGGTIAALYAASHPERVEGLLLISSTPSWVQKPDLPWVPTPDEVRAFAQLWSSSWGTGAVTVSFLAPSMTDDVAYLEWMARYERQSLTPAAVVDLWELDIDLDIRAVLSAVQTPTLVLHRRHDLVDYRCGEYLAEHIPDARLEILVGSDHLPWIGDADAVTGHMRDFIRRRHAPPEHTSILTTVLCIACEGPPTPFNVLEAIVRCQRGTLRTPEGAGPLLATFDLPSAAVTAAAQIASDPVMRGVNAKLGVHTGEIHLHSDTIRGPALPIAQDLANAAEPGRVLASASVRDLCAGTNIAFDNLSQLSLPGFGDLNFYSVTLPNLAVS